MAPGMGLLAKVTLLGTGMICAMVAAAPTRARRKLMVSMPRWGLGIGTLLERDRLGSVDDVKADGNAWPKEGRGVFVKLSISLSDSTYEYLREPS